MLFNTPEFGVLLLGVLLLCAVVRSWRPQNLVLLAASWVFYGWWDVRFLPLLLFSTVTDFAIALRLERTEAPRRRRGLVALSCGVNLGLLGFFKYWGLFESTANGIGHWLGLEQALLPDLHVVLPVGISFYTFQSMAYTIDVYRGRVRACGSLRDVALYVGFFPQLVAGPIERAGRLLPQIRGERRPGLSDLEAGLFLFASGWFRKALGDRLGAVADPAFADPAAATAWQLLWGLYAFTFQIYLDFSGYTDMARGVARMLGFELMENFQAPYFSRSVQEFWQRWHVSLSTWLRDYLYVPLGGNRGSRAATARNLMLTMLLGGLWHGAAWNFVVWGGLHGLYLVAHRGLFGRAGRGRHARGRGPRRLADAAAAAFTFHLVALSWIPFRARPVGEQGALAAAADYLAGLAGLPGAAWTAPPLAFQLLALVLVCDVLIVRRGTHLWCDGWPWAVRGAVLAGLALLAFVLDGGGSRAFIYFQF